MACRWMNDPEPGCMGAAVYGPQGCTCRTSSKDDRIDVLERRVEKLERELKKAKSAPAQPTPAVME
jgi:hypothetical protein